MLNRLKISVTNSRVNDSNPNPSSGRDSHMKQPVHNKVIPGFQALRQARALVAGWNPRQKGSCTSQSGLANHCATDAPALWPRG
ncbi:hypothetical protein PoB_003143700 [Plakobranchus ocellatus]|uniref:Uncharacterized protein n=1 Tax=Plakobranchus ocellatus TaxID=259542 RepID=A0AAV4ADB6_9GAST|nr:hypothetical protein PoB_003143700 [Plakobranchus ocellatus]